MADPLDPFQAGPGQDLADPFLLTDPMRAMGPDPMSVPVADPVGSYDLLDQVEDSVLYGVGPEPTNILDELERSIEESLVLPETGPMEDGLKAWDAVDAQPAVQTHGLGYSPPPKNPLMTDTGQAAHFYRQPVMRMWRPRGGSTPGVSSMSASGEKEPVRRCPRTEKMVTAEECEGCEAFREGACQREGEEANEQEQRSG
ncbi:MAG: hypothetical protein KJ621_10855 [Proteobacteria bacterium]|nr:hypothetical protein [Pseudomonadota bacterium]